MATATKPERTALAVVEPQSPIALALLSQRSQIEDLLPEGVSLTRVIAAVKLQAIKNPALLVCTPISLVESVARIQQLGLVIGVTAFIVPFAKVATAVAGYKGLIQLMVASGAVRGVQAKAVYENDQFKYELGLHPALSHLPEGDPQRRGALKGAYCILRMPGNAVDRDLFDFMSIEDIEAIRKQYSKQWGPDKVKECPAWYAIKTIIRRTANLVPQTPRFAKFMRVLDEDRAMEEAEPVEATIVSSTPSAEGAAVSGEVKSAPAGASEDQITRILDLVEHDGVDGALSEKIKATLTRGMRASRAVETIAHLEQLIAAKAAARATAASAVKKEDDLPF